jgi:ABC-2 type transport system permease protein
MGGVRPIVRREYLERVKSKWFVFGTFVMPLFMAGLMVIPWLFVSGRAGADRTIVLVDETGVLWEGVARRLDEGGFSVRVAEPGAQDSLWAKAMAGELGGYLVLGPETLRRGQVVFVGRESPGLAGGMTIRSAVSQSALEVRLGEEGTREELESLLTGGAMEVRLVGAGEGGPSDGDPEFMGVFLGTMLLYMVILLYAVAVLRATMEEKTGRVVEILVSSVRPGHLMLGKILGVGSVGLTQLGVWVALGALMVTLGLPALAMARPDGAADPAFIAGALPGPGQGALFLALFLGGYFLYGGVYAAVGAMCSTEEEAQQAQFPVVLLLVLPVLFLMPVMEDPGSTLAVVASLVPFFTPILLYARVGMGDVPLWEIVGALVLLYGAVLAVAWVAGRIYRVGMLMEGKRPNLPELWRWVREA